MAMWIRKPAKHVLGLVCRTANCASVDRSDRAWLTAFKAVADGGRRVRQSAGFTLLEVLVALAVVALTLVPLLRLHLLSLDATLRAQDLTTAVLLAQGQLAAMGVFPETGENAGKYDHPDLNRFRWETIVTEQAFDPSNNTSEIKVRQIAVRVLWADGQREQQYFLEAYATQNATP